MGMLGRSKDVSSHIIEETGEENALPRDDIRHAFVAAEASSVGTKYGSLNQDRTFLKRLVIDAADAKEFPTSVILAVVLDGHGMLGEVAADAAGKVILENMELRLKEALSGKKCKGSFESLKDIGNRQIKEMIQDSFSQAHEYVLGVYSAAPPEYHFPDAPGHGVFWSLDKELNTLIYRHPDSGTRLVEFGTTVSLVVMDQTGFLAVAHVGDSDVVVGSLEESFAVATEITKPHSGFNLGERYRIGELLCEDDDMMDRTLLRDDGYLEVNHLGGLPSSVALGMTRAIGHFHMQDYGVIPRPDISFYDFEGDDVCVILASDGVWDAFHPRDAVHFVCKSIISLGKNVEDATSDLCNICVQRQMETIGAADNTSAIVIFHGALHPKKSSSAPQVEDISARFAYLFDCTL